MAHEYTPSTAPIVVFSTGMSSTTAHGSFVPSVQGYTSPSATLIDVVSPLNGPGSLAPFATVNANRIDVAPEVFALYEDQLASHGLTVGGSGTALRVDDPGQVRWSYHTTPFIVGENAFPTIDDALVTDGSLAGATVDHSDPNADRMSIPYVQGGVYIISSIIYIDLDWA